MNSDVTNRVKEIQTSMVESAKSSYNESDLGHLRCVIRLAVEFHYYLEHGSTEMARGLQQGAHAKYFNDLQSASTDPFNKYDLDYTCGSIRSGVDSFCRLKQIYKLLDSATGSRIKWGMISSRESFKATFVSMFNNFAEEVNFESKCRLLLDLFKLQIVFAGISCDD